MECPRCKVELSARPQKEVRTEFIVDACPGCGGSWYDKEEFEKLERVQEPVFMEFRRLPSREEQLKGLFCPSCDSKPLLDKVEHSRDHKVLMDVCPECNGVWLDSGELEAIQKQNFAITLRRIASWLLGNE